MDNLTVTIAICTWNRCQSLRTTLLSVANMTIPEHVSWDIMVVDNGSDDNTASVVREFESKIPISRVFEERMGLSIARNTAIRSSNSDYIIFTDDDVIVDKAWLKEYCIAFRRWPNASVFGGPIEPLFTDKPPTWLSQLLNSIGYVYGRQTFGNAALKLDETMVSDGPYGGNMAFLQAVLNNDSFDVELGTKREAYNIGEETKLIRSILAAGAEGWWIPSAKIQHRIPKSAQNIRYIRRWMVGAGRHDEITDRISGVRPIGSGVLHMRILMEELKYACKRPFLSPAHWIGHVINSSKAKGRLWQRKSDRASKIGI